MPNTRLGRHGSAIALVVSGAIALIACQRMAPTPASLDTPPAPAPQMQPLQPAVSPARSNMTAAVSAGQFEEPFVKPTATPMPIPTAVPTPELPRLYQSGIASTYGEGDGFEGNRTACGRIFHTHDVQIAHKSLPCGTRVRVEDAYSGKFVVAEVTDRGPYVAGRIVDLSWGAFRQLDQTSPGLLHVNLYVVDADS
ncbi:MAG: hypothetical protein JOY61_25105 [Chloroflexi bacterium]|nr:hypothetical protein [Chloroflexota bacterium]